MSNPSRTRGVERALWITFVCHGVAMLGMAALLLPAMPGGSGAPDSARVAYIAEHPWLFRAGWLPWHATAASDLLLAIAMVRARWIPRGLAWAVLALTVVAVALDQSGQVMWITRGVDLAKAAHASGNLSAYLDFEALAFPLTGWYAALAYTLGAIAWSFAFTRSGTWSRVLTWLSFVVWGDFLIVTIGPLLPAPVRLPDAAVAVGNGLGFVLMEAWFLLVLEQVLRRERPASLHGRYADWRHPRRGLAARALEAIANSRVVRAVMEPLPVLDFHSDIRDVVYVNYLVPAERLAAFVPEGLTLQTLGPNGQWALFTFLTYHHGHFGPRILGPLRRAFPSPVQTNWRTYVRDEGTGKEGIYFVTNAVSTTLHAMGARLMAEGMPMHLLGRASLERDQEGRIRAVLEGAGGSAPDAVIDARPTALRELDEPWSACFESYEAMLRYNVPQDRALSSQPWASRVTSQEIDLGIPIESCEPLEGTVLSRAAAAIVGDAKPLIFRVPVVSFKFSVEQRHTLSGKGRSGDRG